MANKKISDLAAGSTLDGTERFEAEQPASTTSVYLTGTQIKTWALSSPTITGHPTIEGVTSTGATGTGNLVFSASPTLSGTVGGALTFSGALTLSSALTYGGVTLSNSVTGTGNMVLATTPTLTTPVIGAATGTSLSLSTGASNVTIAPATANTEPLTVTMGTMTANTKGINITGTWNNSGVTFDAPLFMNITNTASASGSLFCDIQVAGSSRLSFDNTGVLINDVAGSSAIPTLYFRDAGNTKTPIIQWPASTGLIFKNASGVSVGAFTVISSVPQFQYVGGALVGWVSGGVTGTVDTALSRFGAATLQHGAADAASPVAQTIRVQSVVAGTSNTAGTDWTLNGSAGTGTGAGGKIILQTAPAGSTGTAQNALAAALTLTAPAVNMQPSVVVGNQALATTATDGFLYIPTCAGTPTGVPTTFTGRVAMVYDTTNHKFYIYDTAWKGGTNPGAYT